jgi:hypothetical protein
MESSARDNPVYHVLILPRFRRVSSSELNAESDTIFLHVEERGEDNQKSKSIDSLGEL